jgi:hypothetical protein
MTTDAPPVPAGTSRGRAALGALARLYAFVLTPYGFAAALVAYVVIHAALRVWTSPNIGTDEVEQALFAQSWAWGYNPRQPPLFTWLLLGAYAAFGTGIVAHVALKYATLAAMYALAYACARRLIAARPLAALATLAIVLIYGFGWGVHTGVTHTLLMSALMFAALLALLRVADRRRTRDYGVLGLALGIGLLTKYSFGLFAVPLLAALLAVPALRGAVLDRRMLLALAIAAAIFLPHGIWMLTTGTDYGTTLAVLGAIGARHGYLANVAAGLASLVQASVLFLAPFWLVALALFWPAARAPGVPARPWLRALALALAFGVALLALSVLSVEVTYFKDRRMHAVLLVAPLLLFVWLDHRAVDARRLGWFAGAIGAVVAVAFLAQLGQALFEPYTCRRCWLHMPLPGFAQAIRDGGFAGGTIIAAEEHVGGNLRLAFPEARVLTPAYPTLDPPAVGGSTCLLAWHARLVGDAVPPPLAAFVAGRFKLAPAGTPTVVDLPMLRRAARRDRFAYLVVSNAGGDCRAR